jgi:hypothetical protein
MSANSLPNEASASSSHAAKPRIVAKVARCVNYASWQNSVPVIRSLELHNDTDETLTQLHLELTLLPPFARSKSWIIESLGARSSMALRDRDLHIDFDYLAGLNEAERGIAAFRLAREGQVLAESLHEIRVLAREEWGGIESTGELLAAFVMPNDPALAPILKSAGEILSGHGHSPALDGYQSGDPRRSYLLAAAAWSAVAAKSLTYANPPRSFEAVGQKVRSPATILGAGLATCLDTTLLFASALEAIGLNPLVILQQGHCFVGVWLVEKTLSRLIETDCAEIRKAIAAQELVTFETTLITRRPPACFEDAVATARRATQESEESKFVAAIDVGRARMSQIRPLASHQSAAAETAPPPATSGPLPLPPSPSFDSMADEETIERPATAAGRIERWQRKLLDLSLRNRLLNFKMTKQTVPICCPDIAFLEDRLAAGARLRLTSLPDQNLRGERDAELHRQKEHADLDEQYARQALQRDEVSCPLSSADLTSRLTTLYRAARNDLAEGGSNTLFLAIGFLKWKRPEDSKTFRAPLLLAPVKLVRNSALSPFQLVHHEDDVRFNSTLVQLLKKDFGRDISGLDGNLPTDEHGVDVPRVLERMRREVRDIPGFEVVDELALSTFSFAKYLMWKDLVDRLGQLESNRVVRHLIHEPDKPFSSAAARPIPRPEEIDRRFAPKDIFHPLPADSSQLAAVMAASEGHDFVLVGPPGTGKSQTIANLIAQCLATGKTVLFVAEKTAALDVVYRRLRERGLSDCCVELHSNHAERRSFLEQLAASWQRKSRASADDWIKVSEKLQIRRDELNAYVSALHAVHPNGWTTYKALGVASRGAAVSTPPLPWPHSVRHDAAAFATLADVVAQASLTYQAIDPRAKLSCIKATEWSLAWQSQLLACCDDLKEAARTFLAALGSFAACLQIPGKADGSAAEVGAFEQLAANLAACAGEDMSIIFNKSFAKLPAAARELQRAIELHRKVRASASAAYDDATIPSIPLDDLDRRWREAVASFWPKSWFAKRKIRRLLQSYAADGVADPATDLQAIREQGIHYAAIAANPLADQTPHWDGVETDANALGEFIERSGQLRRAIVEVGRMSSAPNDVTKSLLPAIQGGSSELPVYRSAAALLQASGAFRQSLDAFARCAMASAVDPASTALGHDAIAAAEHVHAFRTHLQRWTAWCAVRSRAEALGLTPLISDLETGRVAPAELPQRFELAYGRWWLPIAIDDNAAMRSFQRFQHEAAIEDFRRLDELARQAASAQVRSMIAHQLPEPDEVPRKSELGLLRHQMGLKRPSKSIRDMIGAMPESFGKLAPCLLMSPLSIAQYLPTDQALFDVVIFDEASQITTWDAIGAIARGKQTIIVGDPKQLPPTNFFGRGEDDEDNEELDDHERDLESILDEAQASGLPTLQLNWHYRSQHESLIAFSNWHYYGNKLITFPSAHDKQRGVSLCFRPQNRYDRGKSRTNPDEAKAIVDDAARRMRAALSVAETDRPTFGVITFNSQQQSLILDLFDEARRDSPELEWYFADERIEPTIVKNLENVQGDERDVMFFSITFGPDAAGKLPLTFGALNRDGGERRLNVAVTRARQQLIVYSSFRGEQLNADRSQKLGVRHLKNFLDYAEKGALALAAQVEGSVGGYDSPLEEAVAAALESRGWQIVPQVGVSGFRIDLGVVHPDKPGAFLAGVECDGATYHRSAIARDRDKTRQIVLENLGWKIVRVWSPEWWYDAATVLNRLHESLEQWLEADRQVAEASAAG